MKAKLTFREWWQCLIGKPYLLNTNSGEIHDLREKTKHCWIPIMNPRNKRYLSYKEVFRGKLKGYQGKPWNGCKWCLKKHDTG